MHTTLFDALAYDLPAVDLRPRPLSCFDVCRAHLANGAIEAADATSISFLTPTGSVQVDIANGVDSVLLFALRNLEDTQRNRVLSDEGCAVLVKAVVANQFQGQRITQMDTAWNLCLQRRTASIFDEIAFLASISTPEDLRELIEEVKATALSLPPIPKFRFSVIVSAVPVWDAKLGVLRLGGKVALFRNQQGGIIRALLDTFQAKGWPSWIATDYGENRVRAAASDIGKKTVGWLKWHAAADGQVRWEQR